MSYWSIVCFERRFDEVEDIDYAIFAFFALVVDTPTVPSLEAAIAVLLRLPVVVDVFVGAVAFVVAPVAAAFRLPVFFASGAPSAPSGLG
jgi:hypothetical protein